jgi:DNA invertase Pin-like site-specific DNA recombinase
MSIAYVRVSTRRQVTDRIQREIDLCHDIAARRALTVAEVFVDEGVTGFSGDRREYKRMLAYIRERRGALQYVIVPDLSRLWRNSSEYRVLRTVTALHGVKILSARDGAVDDSIEGRLIEDVIAWGASYDATVKKELSAKAQNQMVEAGLWPFRPPLGYEHGRFKGYLVADENAAPAIRRLFQLVAHDGMSVADLPSIAEELNLRRGGRLLSSTEQYRRILSNPLYAGRIVLASGLRATARFEPLVDGDTFDAVQARLARRTVVKPKGERRLPLSGFVICGECGYALSGSYAKNKYAWYRCKEGCAKLRASDFNEMFIRFANALAGDVGMETVVSEIAIGRVRGGRESEMSKIEQELDKIRDRKDQLIEWRQDGSLHQDEWQRTMTALRLKEERAFDRIQVMAADSEADAQCIQQITTRLFQSPGKTWGSLPVALQRQLQEALFPEGIVFEEGKLRTHAINPVFNGFGVPFMQVRTLVLPSGGKLELEGRPWHRRPRKEMKRLMGQHFGLEIDIGIATPHDGKTRCDSPSAAA